MKSGAPGMNPDSGRVVFRANTRAVAEAVVLLLLILQGVHSRTTRSTPNISKTGPATISNGIQLQKDESNDQVVVDNGIIQVIFSSPEGLVTGIKYNGIDNVLNEAIEERGYWDVVWYEPGQEDKTDKLLGTEFRIITQNKEQVEISFTRTWNVSVSGSWVPLNVDKRYIVRTGSSGVYMYAVMEKLEGWPDVDMDQIRIVFKLNPKKFNFMAISDSRQRSMPSEADRNIENGRAKELAFKEAVLLTNPGNPSFRGEVDDKYMYSCEDKDNRVHGWISSDPPVGFWMITPSNEFRVGGPHKQDLTSHAGPTVLSMFTSTHYAGKDMDMEYRNGKPWKKVFGPVFAYLNSVPPKDNPLMLWRDAKRRMQLETRSWPYEFVALQDYPLHHQRGSVKGQLYVRDTYIYRSNMWGKYAYVGLAPPGEVGSWQTEAKGYQFWTKADRKGFFLIENVRPGNYSLFAWVPSFIGDYKYERDIIITPGGEINVGAIVYAPPRNGPTLWEIGVPDRTAGEFFIPDPNATFTNKLFVNMRQDRFRQYGLWARYADLYPDKDLVYTVGESDFRKNWFFAQVTRNAGNDMYKATTWQIVFKPRDVNQAGNYTLRIALASATASDLQVRINEPNSKPVFTTGTIGRDNAIARHGIHGLYRLYSINVSGRSLRAGDNIIYLTQAKSLGPFQGVMYDYIRLERPPRV